VAVKQGKQVKLASKVQSQQAASLYSQDTQDFSVRVQCCNSAQCCNRAATERAPHCVSSLIKERERMKEKERSYSRQQY
jgi:hypothetical protein